MNGHPVRAAVVLAVLLVAGCTGDPPATGDPSPVRSVRPPLPAPTLGLDAFYDPPDPLDHAAPGGLIRAQRVPSPGGVLAWRVLYHSRSIHGEDVAVSGTVAAPDDAPPPGGRPVVAWAHPTTGFGDRCAPSRAGVSGPYWLFLPQLVQRGYVVAATDYEGLGTPGPHPYLVGGSEGRGVLDAVRAAAEIPETGASNRMVVFGHSQGGHASLFAGQLAGRYAPELELAGTVALAPPGDLAARLDDPPPTTNGFGVAVAVGFSAAYPRLRLEDVLTPWALDRLEVLEEGCVTEVLRTFEGPTERFFSDTGRFQEVWADLLETNSAGAERIDAPVLIQQGEEDDLVPAAATDALVARLCSAGTAVDYRRYPGNTHVGIYLSVRIRSESLGWIADRFAGRPAPSTCAGTRSRS